MKTKAVSAKANLGASRSLRTLAHFGQTFPVLVILIRFLATIFRVKCNSLTIFDNVHSDSFVSDHLFVARSIRDIPDYNPAELPHVDQRGAHVAWAQSCKDRCQAEILPSSVANGRSFAMTIGMAFLHQGIVPFPQNLACVVTDNDATNRAPSFLITFLRQQNRKAHKVCICHLLEEPWCSDRGQTPRRKVGNDVEHVIGDGRLISEERCCHVNRERARFRKRCKTSTNLSRFCHVSCLLEGAFILR